MAARSLATEFCLKITDNMTPKNVSVHQDKKGFLEALFTERNLATTSQAPRTLADAGGKRITLVENYLPRASEDTILDSATDGAPNFCDAGTQDQEFQREVTFTENDRIYTKIQISEVQMREFCKEETKMLKFMQILRARMNAMYNKIDKKLIAEYEAIRGNFADGTNAPKTGRAFDTAGNVILNQTSIRSQIIRQYRQINADAYGIPFVVGDNLFDDYSEQGDIGCCNNEQGVDTTQAKNGLMYFRDPNVGTELAAADDLLVFAPGVLIPIEWNENIGDFDVGLDFEGFDDYRHISTTLNDFTFSESGMLFDMELSYQRCTPAEKGFTITLSKHIKLLPIPNDAFAATDFMNGVNFLFRMTPTQA